MIKKRLILVRHGHCDKSGTYCGSTDAPLTKKGRSQALAVAEKIASVPISVCYYSPLRRASQTARILCSSRRIRALPAPALKEIDFGLWEGLTYSEIAARWPDLAERWLADPAGVTIPGGEPFSAFSGRIRRFLQNLSKEGSARNILIVAHGGSLAALMMEILGKPVSEFFKLLPALASIQKVDWRSRGGSAEPC
ncbi:MAG: histidine phosphatase family protein [Elusimicrobia bacterium]|nr:histidine phosphatase family protein [Elusimicrobiota bacterium]